MVSQSEEPIFCNNIGSNSPLECCYPSDQNKQSCIDVFKRAPNTFHDGSGNDHYDDCLSSQAARASEKIYGSYLEDGDIDGPGVAPVRQYLACANVPNIAHYQNQGTLNDTIVSKVGKYVPKGVTEKELQNITFAVTDCLTATCRSSRGGEEFCGYACSGVNLLKNSTTPDMNGLHQCMRTLCNGQERSLPFADADVVGIGVFASYLMQDMITVIVWFLFTWFFWKARHAPRVSGGTGTASSTQGDSNNGTGANAKNRSINNNTNEKRFAPPKSRFEDLLSEFHSTQCYFSGTIQIAALTYGIFHTDMLITFMLIPLAINGVLPVVFTLVLLYNCDDKPGKRPDEIPESRSGPGVLLLTTICWVLSSLVYWTLYMNVVPINSDLKIPGNPDLEYRAYRQFYYKLSAQETCGGYSALAACPAGGNFKLARGDIVTESHKIRVLTPIIWTFSTVCLLAILGAKLSGFKFSKLWKKTGQTNYHPVGKVSDPSPADIELAQSHPRKDSRQNHSSARSDSDSAPATQKTASQSHAHNNDHSHHESTINIIVYILVTLCFLAGIGMQLSLLSIFTSLHMMDRKDWSFGQVVAVTIWIPPLVGYVYREAEVFTRKFHSDWAKKRTGNT